MNKLIFMLIIVGFLCGGAWATGITEIPANLSLVETPAAATNITVILKEPFQNEDEGMYALMSLSWNQKMREALTTVNWAVKYVAAKVKGGIDRLDKNMVILRDLHRRRQEALNVAFRAKERRIKKLKPAPPLKLATYIKPITVRLLTKPTFLSILAANINATTGQPYVTPKKIIVAMI